MVVLQLLKVTQETLELHLQYQVQDYQQYLLQEGVLVEIKHLLLLVEVVVQVEVQVEGL